LEFASLVLSHIDGILAFGALPMLVVEATLTTTSVGD
jgi:hypothetical protein